MNPADIDGFGNNLAPLNELWRLREQEAALERNLRKTPASQLTLQLRDLDKRVAQLENHGIIYSSSRLRELRLHAKKLSSIPRCPF